MAAETQKLSIDQAITVAMRAYSSGANERAGELLAGVLRVRPDSGPALHLLSLNEAAQNKPAAAKQRLRQSLISHPNAHLPWVHLGIRRRQADDSDAAVAAFDRSLAIAPSDAYALVALAGVMLDRDDKRGAIRCARAATIVNPSNVDALSVLTQVARSRGDDHRRAVLLARALVLRPDDVELNREFAACLNTDGELEKAEFVLRQCLKVAPKSLAPAHDLAILLHENGRTREAEETLVLALAGGDESASGALMLAEFRSAGGRLELGSEAMAEADPGTVRALARLIYIEGQADAAIDLLEKLLEIIPRDLDTVAHLCEVLLDYGDLRRAESILSEHNYDDQRLASLIEEAAVIRARDAADAQFVVSPAQERSSPLTSDAALLGHVAKSLDTSALNIDPCPYRFATSLLEQGVYNRIMRNMPDPSLAGWGGNSDYPDRGMLGIDVEWGDGVWREALSAFTSEAFTDLAVEALNAGEFRAYLEAEGCRLVSSAHVTMDRQNYALGPHRDHASRFATLLLYLPRDDTDSELGTSLYKPIVPMPRLDHGKHHAFKKFERVATIPFLPNSGILFLNFGPSYHGVEPISRPALRPMLQATIYIEQVR
ncbi:MAG: tetratricopeptide repeat protein [Rhodospirillaceae bacterium]|jgi:tetratricopeptide (TPR) repeat protein|nr:tetratricopeptide repeat protein [Rhodospirillaceae bacterium]